MNYKIKGKLILDNVDTFIEKSILPKDFIAADIISPLDFIAAQEKIKAEYPKENQTKIYVRSYEELRYSTCLEFKNENGEPIGYVAVTEMGEIVSLLKRYNSKIKNFMGMAYANAIMVGGNRLDCYSCENLGPSYCKRGFIPICKISFDLYASHPDMVKYYGEPDIIFYIYCGDPVFTFCQRMNDSEYMMLDHYDFIPHIRTIQENLGISIDDMNYDFAHHFRDVILGKWNSGLKREFMFKPAELMKYVCSDYERLAGWLKE